MSEHTMQGDLVSFFDRFARDFSAFSGELIAQRYSVPYLAVSSEGEIRCYRSDADVAEYFQSVLDQYRQQGVVSCRYRDLVFTRTGSACVSATVTWTLLDGRGEAVLRWRESYGLVERDDGLLIYCSADFTGD